MLVHLAKRMLPRQVIPWLALFVTAAVILMLPVVQVMESSISVKTCLQSADVHQPRRRVKIGHVMTVTMRQWPLSITLCRSFEGRDNADS